MFASLNSRRNLYINAKTGTSRNLDGTFSLTASFFGKPVNSLASSEFKDHFSSRYFRLDGSSLLVSDFFFGASSSSSSKRSSIGYMQQLNKLKAHVVVCRMTYLRINPS
jgi:hypothetical protein